jgi:transposase
MKKRRKKMTLHPQREFSIPEETTRVARAAYPKGNLYLKMRDALGTIYQDESFAHLFPQNGRPVEARLSAGIYYRGAVHRGTA